MPEFVEKYLSANNRHQMFDQSDKASFMDIPVSLHTLKTESSRFLKISELSENQ